MRDGRGSEGTGERDGEGGGRGGYIHSTAAWPLGKSLPYKTPERRERKLHCSHTTLSPSPPNVVVVVIC